MAKNKDTSARENFRPDLDPALDREIDAALGDISLDDLYATDAPQPARPSNERFGTKQVRRGTIIRLGKDEAFVDFGGKSQGVVSLLQFDENPEIGAEMEFIVDRFDAREGMLILSRRGATATDVSWDNLEIGQIVEAVVTGVNKGGLQLEVKGMRAFMPSGQVELFHVPNFEDYIGQKLTAEVTQFEREAKNLVLSRRNVLEREKEALRVETMKELAEGQIRRGTVRNVMDFGAFIDLGGVDGLLHVSELTFKRGKVNAQDLIKVGDVVDVKVVRIDKETGKLSLSLKQARGEDPWANATDKYRVGTTVTGRITRIETFGAFVEIEEGFEGLLPISEISWQRIAHPSDVVKVGDTVKLTVLSLDPTARRASFSLKQAGPDPWSSATDRYAADMVVDGRVTRVADFGAFVELEPGLEGLVHLSELSDARVRTPSDVVKVGQSVKVRVLDVDKQSRRISLSLRGIFESASNEPTAPIDPKVAEKKAQKRAQLRGGLDF